jgi:tetratricopeptide (TPR) repeat protein
MGRGIRAGTALVLAGAIVLTAGVGDSAARGQGEDPSREWRARGLEAGFNLDHDDAEAAFRRAIAADPSHPAGYRLLAALAWTRILWARGTVTVDDYFGRVSGDVARPAPPAQLAAAFNTAIREAIAAADARLRERRGDADAHYQVGAAYGLLTLYHQSVEGRVGGGLSTARRAVQQQEEALRLDPGRKDAGLQLGLYRYGVSALALPLRIVARAFGLSGDRARGIMLVEEAARHPSEAQTNARLALVAIYNRERRYDAALQVLNDLQRQYPRNRLLWLEAGATAIRAGRLFEAARYLREGDAKLAVDRRPLAGREGELWQRQRALLVTSNTNGRKP